MATERPPLELQVELVYPDGSTTRWDKDSREAKDRPTGITFRTQRYTGFADAQLTLNRRIDLEYPDLGLLDGLNLIGHDGSVAYEGRIASMPRNLQSTPQITVQAQGWMSHAKDEPFVEVYVDRDLSKWTAPGIARRAALIAGNYALGSQGQAPDESGTPSVELSLPDSTVAPYKPLAEAWWLPQAGITIGAVYYNFAESNAKTMVAEDANWKVGVALASDDKDSESDGSGTLWPGPKAGYLEAAGTRAAAFLQLLYEEPPFGIAAGGAAGASFYARFEQLAVYGAHSISVSGAAPGGFTVSQMITNIAQRFAPKLDTSGIEETTFVVPHASFTSEVTAYNAFQTLNAYHRWEMGVFENRKLIYKPVDLSDYDWEVRQSDAGTTVDLHGDDTENLCNGVVVRYTDLATGYETRLSPDDFPELRDDSPDNPANLHGDRLYQGLALSVPTTKEGAIQIGRVFLAEFNQPQATGSITIEGHIRDRAGHWQQGWKCRAGDRVTIADLANDAVRVIAETSWDHDRKQLTIAIDQPMKRLDAILARLGVAVEASGFSLP
jgi:hypothetical protein